ncbi:MAG: AraC family transcriptional regulator [Candidatus Azotimanducaceae bacterium]|jgi:AraC family transcriptional regulator
MGYHHAMTKEVYKSTGAAFQPHNAENRVHAVDNINVLVNTDVARWNVDKNNITYLNQHCHTLSIYLQGGESSYRADDTFRKGSPGKICLMPKDHQSEWHINGAIEFVHLYFSDQMLKQYATAHFNSDVRFIELRDLVYEDDKVLENLFHQFFALCDNALFSSPLFAEETIHKVLHHLIKNYNGFTPIEHNIKGGLSPYHMRLSRQYIGDNIQAKQSISHLASLADLSPFHFARMFKISFGESPAKYITRVRIDAIKRSLKTTLSLAEISLQHGFSQQSHMSKNFKALTGFTPAIYRMHL